MKIAVSCCRRLSRFHHHDSLSSLIFRKLTSNAAIDYGVDETVQMVRSVSPLVIYPADRVLSGVAVVCAVLFGYRAGDKAHKRQRSNATSPHDN